MKKVHALLTVTVIVFIVTVALFLSAIWTDNPDKSDPLSYHLSSTGFVCIIIAFALAFLTGLVWEAENDKVRAAKYEQEDRIYRERAARETRDFHERLEATRRAAQEDSEKEGDAEPEADGDTDEVDTTN